MTFHLVLALAALQAAGAPARVVVRPESLELPAGESRALRAVAYDARGTVLTGRTAVWASNQESVAVVDSTGRVSALRPGTARVTALIDGAPGFATVTVPELPAATIAFDLPAEAILEGTSLPARVSVRNRLGEEIAEPGIRFESRDPRVAAVDALGRVYGRRPGRATIVANAGPAAAQLAVRVASNPAEEYLLEPADALVRTGDVVRFRVTARGADGRALAVLQPAWTVSGGGARIEEEGTDGVFVAEAPGIYRVTAVIGLHRSRHVTVRVTERRVPAQLVTVGRGPITEHHSGDTWVFEGVDGRDYAYVGTYMHDWMKAWDVTDPANPVLTDSVRVDARRINDVKIHPSRRIGVITREGASNRRNGIVILDLREPAHPKILSEFTETVTGGVHNVWIRGDEDLVYACHNGTSDLHIIDISNPRNPRQAGRWGLEKASKTLHDVIVQDGYAYLSYWDDGVVMLDVGAGTHGGSPTVPAFVSQFRYPVGNTHVAWRHGRYLFVGDEIFPEGWDPDRPIEARGYVHVLDYSDPERPREVARYEVPEAGAHNVWTEADRLYVGYYQAGLRVVDISGELRGDLYRQGREIAALKTTDARTTVPNWPMTWGAQVFKGHIFSSDFNSGLWVTRLEEPRPLP